MNLQRIHPKALVYLRELSGKGGVMWQTPEILACPHFNKACDLYMRLPTSELNNLLKTIVHPSGAIINWHTYLNYNERAYKPEYLKSEAWKRKRDAVMARAMRPLPPDPDNLVIVSKRDAYGRVVESIKLEWKSICEVDGCENEAKDVHHVKNYDNLGREQLEDLQALCKKCHDFVRSVMIINTLPETLRGRPIGD